MRPILSDRPRRVYDLICRSALPAAQSFRPFQKAKQPCITTPMSPSKPPAPSFLGAVVIILIGIFLLDVMGAIVKHLLVRYPVMELAVVRNFIGLAPTLLILMTSRKWHAEGRSLKLRQWRIGVFRGLSVSFAQVCYYTALIHLELATVSTLVFAGPLFITALSVPILGDRVGLWRWFAVVIGFVGVIIIIRPGSDVFTPYALLPLAAALGYASSSVVVRLFDHDIPSAVIYLYSQITAFIASTIIMISLGQVAPIQSWTDAGLMAAMGIVGSIGVYCLISSYRLTKPSNLAPFEYFGIAFAFVLGWYFFNEAPFDKLIPGVFLIIGGGLLIIWRESRRSG